MFDCKKHGIVKNGWCEECQEIVTCDCSDLIDTRFKDLTFNTKSGDKTQTVYIRHCETCGAVDEVYKK